MRIFPATLLYFSTLVAGASAGELTSAQRDFFEEKIRPVLANECYECHSTDGKQRAGLVLDHRVALLQGSDNGAVVVPGKPEESLLLTAIKHERDDLKMPKAGVRLTPALVADFEKWIAIGAPDPRDAPPSPAERAAANDWGRVMEQRKNWWSFQPIMEIPVPAPTGTDEGNHVDRFLAKAQAEADLEPSGRADRGTLIRRLGFVLTGLPPSPAAVEAFANNRSENAYSELVDTMLDSTAFGERWARHWMDWFRYAESHGSEGDPSIPFAWKYRDYLIRALNADVPYDQLVREHIAGDLLEAPRVLEGRNESALGTAHYRMVQHGFAPTDAHDEMVRFTDNQIDVVTKGFLGLTVSCARCHNHKFDAISQADFYAMFGIMASCRPATLSVDMVEAVDGPRPVMHRMKGMIRERLAATWRAESIADHLLKPEVPWHDAIENATEPASPLHAWNQLSGKDGEVFGEEWNALRESWQKSSAALKQQQAFAYEHQWKLSQPNDVSQWFIHGTAADQPPQGSKPGEFHLQHEGEQVVGGIFPGGLISHAVTTRDSAVFNSPKVMADENFRVYVRAAGSGQALVRYAVRHYPRDGTVYPVGRMDGGKWRWHSWNLDYWKGDTIHVEVATAADSPVLGRSNAERSWAAISEVIFVKDGEPAPKEHFAEWVAPLFEAAVGSPPKNPSELAKLYAVVVSQCVTRWEQGTLTDSEARFLDYFVSMNLLPNTLDGLPSVAPLVMEFRELESRIEDPTRSPGIVETEPVLQPLLERGDHKQPGNPVQRRFLDAFGARVYPDGSSGRRELADDLVDGNPLAARVIVNRLWHHVFGQGIVATTDNFGRLGRLPTHPQLLDYLALRMRDQGWSIKKLLRLLVSSQAFQRSATPEAGVAELDPGNQLLTHWTVRRLEAEAIRDNILAVSGRLEPRQFGPSANSDTGRRSVYVRVIRNALDPFLSVFDAPVPNSTQGVRDASNVPAQSLTMMNDPFVIDAARRWVADMPDNTPDRARIDNMFLTALGRAPDEAERNAALEFVTATKRGMESARVRFDSLQGELSRAQSEFAGIIDPVREQIIAVRKEKNDSGNAVQVDLHPFAVWDFAAGSEDQIGDLNLQLKGGAKIVGGKLRLNGSSAFAVSSPLQEPLHEKTLEAVVQLDNLDQSGGAALGVETQDGGVFDAIVFAERSKRQWMAGSDGFRRTNDFSEAPPEREGAESPVCITIVYSSDGTITGYRNGLPYGTGYQANGTVTFEKGEAHVLLGLRHSPAGDGRLLAGDIYRARIYDRALTAEEVRASCSGADAVNYVSRAEIDAALPVGQPERCKELESLIADLEAAIAQMSAKGSADPLRPWADLAHSILNLKEFIYLK